MRLRIVVLALVAVACGDSPTSPLERESSRFVFLEAGSGDHSCAITDVGKILCWGVEGFGELGDGPGSCRSEGCDSVGVVALLDEPATSVAASEQTTCATGASGTAYCWGRMLRQLRYASAGLCQTQGGYRFNPDAVPCVHTPTEVDLPAPAKFIDLGERGQSGCALLVNDRAYCWGLGVDGAQYFQATWDTLAVAAGFACGIATDTVFCWGANNYGQLGSGDREDRSFLVPVADVRSPTELVIGGDRACARGEFGVFECWGRTDDEWVDVHTTDGPWTLRPARLAQQLKLDGIVLGRSVGCGLDPELRSVVCWAWGYGGEVRPRSEPLSANFDRLSVTGNGGVCGLTREGEGLACWGSVRNLVYSPYRDPVWIIPR